jgi:hypothetical protein
MGDLGKPEEIGHKEYTKNKISFRHKSFQVLSTLEPSSYVSFITQSLSKRRKTGIATNYIQLLSLSLTSRITFKLSGTGVIRGFHFGTSQPRTAVYVYRECEGRSSRTVTTEELTSESLTAVDKATLRYLASH